MILLKWVFIHTISVVFSEIDENDGLYVFKDGFCKKDGPTEWIGELDVVYDEDKYRQVHLRDN